MTHFPIKDLKRADYNPRKMGTEEMKFLVESIRIHGFIEPIVVNINKDRYGTIVGGHQRLTAVEKLLEQDITPKGIFVLMKDGTTTYEIPAMLVDLSLEAEKQANIGLNNIHGKFEEEKLYDLISEMVNSPTIITTGFNEKDIANILDRSDKEDSKEVIADVCERCTELKLWVFGHAKRSGHPVKFSKDNGEAHE